MKILLVSHYFLPRHRSGVENYTFRLAKQLQQGDDVVIYCREDGHWDRPFHEEDESYEAIPVHRVYFNGPMDFRACYDNPQLNEAFETYVRRLRPDVVHVQHLERVSAGLLEIVHRLGIPLVVTLHDFWFVCPQIQLLRGGQICAGPEEGRKCATCPGLLPEAIRLTALREAEEQLRATPVKRLFFGLGARVLPGKVQATFKQRILERQYERLGVTAEATTARYEYLTRMLGLADLVLSPSRSLIDVVRKCGLRDPPIEYCDNGVPTGLLASFRKTSSPHLRFGYYSAVVAHKGIELLLDAFRQIVSRSVRLVIRGQGNPPYVEKLVEMAAQDNRIHFGQPYDDAKLAKALADIDVLVVPSLWYENSPLLIHEATAVGIPIIAADIGGMAEFVRPEENGLQFRCGDAGDLRRAMERFIVDPTLVGRLNGRPFPIKSIEENAAELRARYHQLREEKLARP